MVAYGAIQHSSRQLASSTSARLALPGRGTDGLMTVLDALIARLIQRSIAQRVHQ